MLTTLGACGLARLTTTTSVDEAPLPTGSTIERATPEAGIIGPPGLTSPTGEYGNETGPPVEVELAPCDGLTSLPITTASSPTRNMPSSSANWGKATKPSSTGAIPPTSTTCKPCGCWRNITINWPLVLTMSGSSTPASWSLVVE